MGRPCCNSSMNGLNAGTRILERYLEILDLSETVIESPWHLEEPHNLQVSFISSCTHSSRLDFCGFLQSWIHDLVVMSSCSDERRRRMSDPTTDLVDNRRRRHWRVFHALAFWRPLSSPESKLRKFPVILIIPAFFDHDSLSLDPKCPAFAFNPRPDKQTPSKKDCAPRKELYSEPGLEL